VEIRGAQSDTVTGFSPSTFVSVSISHVMFHTHVCVHDAVTWRAKEQGWEPSKKEWTIGNGGASDRVVSLSL
jgi:hypothetical protein